MKTLQFLALLSIILLAGCTLQDKAPEISLVGDEIVTIMVGEGFTDPGVSVKDEDLDLDVAVVTKLDVNKRGTYQMLYQTTDSKGQVSNELVRTVIVEDYLMPVNNNGNWGLVDFSGEFVIQAKYDAIIEMSEKYYLAVDDDTFVLYDQFGVELFTLGNGYEISDKLFMYFMNNPFYELDDRELIPYVTEDDLYGYIDINGNKVIPTQFDDAAPFYGSELAVVKEGLSYGYIDREGNQIIDYKYITASPFIDGKAVVRTDDGYFVIDESGNELVQIENMSPEMILPNGLLFDDHTNITCQSNGDCLEGYQPMVSDNIRYFIGFNHEYQIVHSPYKTNKVGMADNTGKLILGLEYDLLDYFSENGLALAAKNELFGYVDESGTAIIDFEYYKAYPFGHKDLAPVCKDEFECGYIDSTGKVMIGFEFDDVKPFYRNGLAPVYNGSYWGLINTQGQIVQDFIYDEIGILSYYD